MTQQAGFLCHSTDNVHGTSAVLTSAALRLSYLGEWKLGLEGA